MIRNSGLPGLTLFEFGIVMLVIVFAMFVAVSRYGRGKKRPRARAFQENLVRIDGAKERYALDAFQEATEDQPESDIVDSMTVVGGHLKRHPGRSGKRAPIPPSAEGSYAPPGQAVDGLRNPR